MEVTIREKSEGPSVQVKKNEEVVAGTGVTPDAQPTEAPAEAPAPTEEVAPQVEEQPAPEGEIKKVE